MKLPRKARNIGLALAAVALALVIARAAMRSAARMTPPKVELQRSPVSVRGGERSVGRSRVTSVGKLRVAELRGSPAQIGFDHASLLRDDMVQVERAMYADFEQRLPSGVVRSLLLDFAGFRYRHLPLGYADARRRELAGQAQGFDEDPFEGIFPTYQRLVYLNSVYDIALSFEHSPIVGCTTFFIDARARGGGLLLARNFDFDVHSVFDDYKVVFFVHEEGAVPFVSVSWPGLVGVVSGVNELGVAVVAHGARAGPTKTRGEPVVHSLRRVLSHAKSARQAVQLLSQGQAMVSHMVAVADQAGDAFVVERLVDDTQHVRQLKEYACVTNHLEGPAKADPKNQRVVQETSSVARRKRGDVLLHSQPKSAADAVALLRDRKAADGSALPLGDRRAIDGLLAAHGVVFDFSEHVLWVSEGPRLLGRFVAFELRSAFKRVEGSEHPVVIPADPLREDPAWKALKRQD
ncbi:MAG TPA: C45 family autoproteolytic acyltransferase/hydrolase [Polyangiaceae bacterium]|nr:C45 family autoproteolytic acyltransferase/hydrolase [Polyangiaceae bacterium]